jgi:bile acid:Na+ symporter, BASS family
MLRARALAAELFGRRFWVPAYTMLALGLMTPSHGDLWRVLVPVFLGCILLFTFLKVDSAALAGELRRRAAGRRIASLAAAKLLAIPLVTWLLASTVAPEWAIGLTLVAAMPAGLTSPAIAAVFGGNLPLALWVVVVTSALCPITVPVLLALLGDGGSAAPALEMADQAAYIALLLGVPWVLSRVVARAAPRAVAKGQALFGPLAIASLCLMIFFAASLSRPTWVQQGASTLAAGLAWTTVVALLAYACARLASFALEERDATAFSCNAIYLNHGLAVAFTARYYPDEATMVLPAILVGVPIVAVVSFAGRRGIRPDR